jgi:hypothetical protein
MKQAHPLSVVVLGTLLLSTPAYADAGAANAVTPYADMRLRIELVDQDGLAKEATATTLRVRAGLKTAVWNGLSALVEGEAITALGRQRYNDTVNGKTSYPVVADPEDMLLNQAWVRWQPDKAIDVTLGRQAVNIDNQRWIGSVGWRQNDQTLDAVRVTAKPAKGLALDYLHSWRVNRVFGPDSPQGIWRDVAIHGTRLAYTIPNIGTISGYGYWLDLTSSPSSSSRTVGVRMAGEHVLSKAVKLTYAAEYARQHDYKGNPRNFALDYVLLEPGLAFGPVSVKAGLERLEGNGTAALQTPLATLHAFNGWADKFLTTPANGLRDLYLDAGYKFPKSGPLKGATVRLAWHDFNATRLGIDYGQEWNAMLTVPINKHLTGIAKVARYDAKLFATDTTKLWFSLEAKF